MNEDQKADAIDQIDEALALLDDVNDLLVDLGDCKRILLATEKAKTLLYIKRETLKPYCPTLDEDAMCLSIIQDAPRPCKLSDLKLMQRVIFGSHD